MTKEPEISEIGLVLSSTLKDYEFTNYTNFRENLDLLKYDEYNTVLPLSWTHPNFSQVFSKTKDLIKVDRISYSDQT
jgi:hypothetical protein